MNKERPRKKHDTTPRHYLCMADRPCKGPLKEEGQNSFFREKIDKDTHEYRDPQCVDTSKIPPPVNAPDCVSQIPTFSDNQKRENVSPEKFIKDENIKIEVLDDNLKMSTNYETTDPYFAYDQYIANELRKYDSQTLAYCKKEFFEVLFNADTGTLLNRYHPCPSLQSNRHVRYRLKIFPTQLTTDPYFAFCQYIASELRKYDHQTLACVKKAFSEILFKADTGTLLKSCHSSNLKHPASVKKEIEQNSPPDTPRTTSSSHNEIDFQNEEERKYIIPVDGETSINPFQSTDEEMLSSWEDILSDSLPSNSEEDDSSLETTDLISIPGTKIEEHSSPEIMRFEDSRYSEEISLPLEYPRKTLDIEESFLDFSPKHASTQVQFSFEKNGISRRPAHQSTKLGSILGNENSLPSTITVPHISNFEEAAEGKGILGNENSLPSTITVPHIFNYEEAAEGKDELVIETTSTGFEKISNFFRVGLENSETSFITQINTEDIIDSVFKHPDEPGSTNLDDALITAEESNEQTQVVNERSLSENLIKTPLIGSKGHENISPRQLFIHSKLSSGELSTSIIRQSSQKKKGKPKKRRIRIVPPNPPKATNYSGTSNKDPYVLTSGESDLDAEISVPMNWRTSVAGNLKARKKTPGVKSRKRKNNSSRNLVKWEPLTQKEIEEHAEYLKTIPICPLSLQNSCCAGIKEDKTSEQV